ncbi:hypothetical protein [Enterobacter sp. DNB-S2]|uniref:hypothetical protein n=1 Tax=Enterobacter sp. DNB-S2 TaxID=2720029 RepID=UPI002159F8EE|nr:hypothetical protein [Enterobacter sp. DNB-S2]
MITPIKATQETLDGCKNAGVIFGQALGDALMAPLDLFNSLSGKASWLLEKLGIIKNESGDLDAAAAKAEAASSPAGSAYIPGGGSLAAAWGISRPSLLEDALTSIRVKANITSRCRGHGLRNGFDASNPGDDR